MSETIGVNYNKKVHVFRLTQELQASNISVVSVQFNKTPLRTTVFFSTDNEDDDKVVIDQIVADHVFCTLDEMKKKQLAMVKYDYLYDVLFFDDVRICYHNIVDGPNEPTEDENVKYAERLAYWGEGYQHYKSVKEAIDASDESTVEGFIYEPEHNDPTLHESPKKEVVI